MTTLNTYLIDGVLLLFWGGFAGLNLWLWRAEESGTLADIRKELSEAEGESSCSMQSAR